MREITKRILIAVILACCVCLIGMFFLIRSMNMVIERYEKISIYTNNQELMSQISRDMYHIESLMYEHILSSDEEIVKSCETRLDELKSEISSLFDELDASFEDNDSKEKMHQISKNYLGFTSNMDVAMEFSRKDSIQSAFYYMEDLAPYINNMNRLFFDMNEKTDAICNEYTAETEQIIRVLKISELVCMLVVLAIIVVCISVVSTHGRKILDHQEEELKLHQQKVMDLQFSTIVGMANLIESRDGETGGHVKRTGKFVDLIVRRLAQDSEYMDRIDESYIDNLWKAAPLHDIGKIKIPDAILQKPGKLTAEEFEIMKMHAAEGGAIVNETMGEIEEPEYLEILHDMAKYHHEKWDGSGYPEGLSGEEIPLCARIMAIADVFDALVSKRCYKAAMTMDEAYKIIEESSGTHFDPVIAGVFLDLRPVVEEYVMQNKE